MTLARSLRRAALVAALAIGLSAQVEAQDGGTLVVRRNGAEIGRELYGVRPERERGLPGSALTAESRYPGDGVRVTTTLQRTPDNAIALFKLRADGPGGAMTILAAGSGARLVVRSETGGNEVGRELPGGRGVVILDEQVWSLYAAVADAATVEGTRLTAIFPRTARRAVFSARRDAAGAPARIELTGEIAGTIVLDAEGRLARLELPADGIAVERTAE